MITLIVLLVVIEAIVLGSLVYTENGLWGFFSLLVAACTYGFVLDKQAPSSLWSWITTNPVQLILGTVGYVIVGVLWSFFKYYSYVREGKRKGVSKDYMSDGIAGKAMTWTAYWPVSLVLHFAGDGIYKFFRWVYDQVSGVYGKILDKVYGE